MALALLVFALVVGLLFIPFGLPGLWVMAAAIWLYSYAASAHVGMAIVVIVALLALLGEFIEFVLAERYTRRYGGSRRASWGAILGGVVGAIVGVPIPVVGSVVGALVGSFAGALAAELTAGTATGSAARAATGALIGRVMAIAAKVGIGCAIIVVALFAVWR